MVTFTSQPNPPTPTLYTMRLNIMHTEQGENYTDEGYVHPITAALEKSGFTELSKLNRLRRMGNESPIMDRHYDSQRYIADHADENTSRAWYLRMRRIMEEINRFCPVCDVEDRDFRFLDLGCCPGGFSSYILDKNPESTGFGISLSAEEGGHSFHMDESLLDRYSIMFANMAKFELGPDSDLSSLPMAPESFDLVVMDVHHLRNQAPMAAHKVYTSQLILGLRAVRLGGSIVLKLHRLESDYTSRILYLLDIVSLEIRAFKPMTMHKERGSFYVIARGVGLDSRGRSSFDRQTLLQHAIKSFQKLWVNLGDEGSARKVIVEDLDFIITVDDLVSKYTYRLGYLGRKVWEIQSRALEGLFKKRGVIVE